MVIVSQSADLAKVADPDEISLYLHVPFCKRQCPYCHFYVTTSDTSNHEAFAKRLIEEASLRRESFAGKKMRSIYFGGGTPSLLDSSLLKKLLASCLQLTDNDPKIEITLEANPETITQEKLEQWRALGINRLSVGVQSLVDQELLSLGRGHRREIAIEALLHIAKADFHSYSVDLMMETPKQNLDSWRQSLKQVIELNPPHLSLYNLVIEPGTAYARREKTLKKQIASPEMALEMLQEAVKTFATIGLNRYEISAFAKPDHESVHNTGYWRGRNFVGIGPSAHSFLSGIRSQNISDLAKWSNSIDSGQLSEQLFDELPPISRQAELLAVHLRLQTGVDLNSFIVRSGELSEPLEQSIEKLIDLNWLRKEQQCLQLTKEGALFYERVAEELIIVE